MDLEGIGFSIQIKTDYFTDGSVTKLVLKATSDDEPNIKYSKKLLKILSTTLKDDENKRDNDIVYKRVKNKYFAIYSDEDVDYKVEWIEFCEMILNQLKYDWTQNRDTSEWKMEYVEEIGSSGGY